MHHTELMRTTVRGTVVGGLTTTQHEVATLLDCVRYAPDGGGITNLRPFLALHTLTSENQLFFYILLLWYVLAMLIVGIEVGLLFRPTPISTGLGLRPTRTHINLLNLEKCIIG